MSKLENDNDASRPGASDLIDAIRAVNEHVLPGLKFAIDSDGDGRTIILVTIQAVSQVWVNSGGPLNDLLDIVRLAGPPAAA